MLSNSNGGPLGDSNGATKAPANLSNEGTSRPQNEPITRTENRMVLYQYPSIPTARELLEVAASNPPGKTIKLTTSLELATLKRYLPSEYKSFTRDESTAIPDTHHAKALQSFLGPFDDTLLLNRSSLTEKWIDDRRNNLTSIARKAKIHLHCPAPKEESLFDRAVGLKLAALGCLRRLEVSEYNQDAARSEKTADIRGVLEGPYANYTDLYKRTLQDNLVGIIAYGSSLTQKDGLSPKDYDNFVVVKSVKRAIDQLSSADRLEWQGVPVNSHVVPYDIYSKYLSACYDSGCNPQTMRVIHGRIFLPEMTREDILEAGFHLAALSIFNKRTALLSRFIEQSNIFVEEVKKNEKSIALLESFTVSPLASLAWSIRFKDYPDDPKLPKREAVSWLLDTLGLPKLSPIFSSAQELLSVSSDDLKLALAESITTSYLALERSVEGFK